MAHHLARLLLLAPREDVAHGVDTGVVRHLERRVHLDEPVVCQDV